MKLRVKDIAIYIIGLFIIISHSMYTYTDDELFNYIIKVALSIFPLLYLLFTMRKLAINRNSLKRLQKYYLVYFLSVLFIAFFDVSGATVNSYIFRFIIFVPLMVTMFVFDKNSSKIFEAMLNIMIFLSIVSLFFWFFGTNLQLISPTGMLDTTWGGARKVYFGIYSEVGTTIYGGIHRNTSIFGEATVFTYFLGSSLLYEWFLGKKDKRKLFILISTMITTFSSSGYLILLYLVVLWAYQYMKEHNKFKQIKWVVIPIVVVLGVSIVLSLIFDPTKLASVRIRMSDYINGFTAWLESPIWGHGYQLDTTVYNTGFSNSISLILVNGGIMFLGIYLFPIIKNVKMGVFNSNKKPFAYFFVGMVLLFGVLIVAYTYHFLMVVAYAYATLIDKRGD